MIRLATLNDIESLNSLLKVFHILLTEEEFRTHPFSKYILYKEGRELIGFLNYEEIYERYEIDYIYVKEEYRRKGIASQMLSFLLKEAEKKEIDNITLEVSKNNKEARNLYDKHGFKFAAKRKQYYGTDDAYLLIRKL